MADFAAVIRKTLANASETTPELRANVYEKARSSVRRQIDAMEKRPPQAAIDRQFQKLEDAINSVEAEYAILDAQSAEAESETPAETPAPVEPEVPAPVEPEPEVPAPVEPEPEVPSEPDPTPHTPEPEIPEPAGPEPEVTPPFDPRPQTPEIPEQDAPLPSSLETNDPDVRGIMDEEPAVPHADEHGTVETAHFEEPSDAVEAVDDVADGLIVGDSAINAPKAMDDRSSAEIETPVSDDAERFEPAAFDDDNFDEDNFDDADDDDGQASIDDVNRTIGELFGAGAVEPETAKPSEPEDPLAEFLKEHEADFTAKPQDSDVSADSSTDGGLSAAARSVDTVSASIGGEFGAVEGERRESSAGIPPLMSSDAEEKSGGGAKKATIAAIVLALLLGGAYAAYEKQDSLTAFYNESALPWWQDLTGGGDSSIGEAATTGEEGGVPVRTVTSTPVENGEESGEEIAAANEETTPSAVEDVSDAEDAPTKFTQRLTEDGTEIDEGPIEGANSNEGSSVSSQTAGTADAEAPVAEEDTADTQAPDATAETPATPVGQRAIFYEERTGSQDGTALAGATVWTVVNESPGGELPVEPAIRAETSIPELGLRMEMTIRRNGDSTFPASHIIELFFRVPESFDGRGIADVQRVTFKTNEQDPGNALIAVPAPLDQNIFLIALTDATTAVETNVQLMTRENWIDIPMQYTNGRRALITLEKGIPGERVFKEVFDAWNANPINN